MSNTLLSKKSALTSRRNIILYIIATILILGIVAGFTNTFHTDNTLHSAGYGETIVMEAEPPISGTPGDYDLLSNLKFAAYKIHHSKCFKGYTQGTVSADIGIGSYTQYLTNTRIVYNETTVFAETISSSSLKSLAEQKYIENDIVIYRPADKISGDSITYKSTAMQMSFDDFSSKYGSVPNQLSKYIINEDTILAVKDENAQKASPLNGDGSEIGFDVPDKLVPNADGNYVFTLTLDPIKSSLYYRNEVRTLGGADQNPKFYSVQVTVTVNAQWIPLSTRTLEEYDIEIPVLGAMRCSGDNYEEFSMIDDPNGEIPEQDFFKPYVEEAKSKPGYIPPDITLDGPLSASDYLASAFASYLSGEKNLDLIANIIIGDFSAYDLTLSVNLDTLDIQAMLADGMYVKYSGDKVYVKNNDVNGYIDIKNIDKLTSDETLTGLLSGIGELDLTKIFGGDMLDVIFRDCELTTENDVTEIPMAFTLDLSDIAPALGDVKVNASIMIGDEDKSLKSITGKVTVGGVVVDIDIRPLDNAPKFPATDGAVDLSGILDFVPDIVSTAKQNTYGVDGEITLNDMTVGVSAYIDRTDGLKAEATINVSGLDVNVKYVADMIYIDALGVNVRGTVKELPSLMEAALDLTGFGKYQSLLSAMLPSSVNEIADMLKSLTVNDDTLSVGLEFIGIPVNIELTRGSGKLQSLALDVNVNLFGIKADVAANLMISEPKAHEVKAPVAESYLAFADLASLIKDVKPYLQDDVNYTADINGSVEVAGTRTEINGSFVIDKIFDNRKELTGVAADGALNVLGQNIAVTYVNSAAYVAIGEIKAKLDVSDANSLISSVLELAKLVTGNDVALPDLDITEILSEGAIRSVSIADGTLSIILSVEGCDVSIAVNLKSGKIVVSANIDNVAIKLDVTIAAVKKNHKITAPLGEYLDVAELSALIDAAKSVIERKSVVVPTVITYGGNTYNATIAADFSDGIKAQISAPEFGLDIVLFGDTVYVSIGQINLCGSLSEAKDLYEEVRKYYPALPELDSFIALPQDTDIEGIINAALGAVKSLESKDGVIYANIEFDGFGAAIKVNADLSELTVETNGITLVMTPEITAVDIVEPNGAYNSIAQLKDFVPTVFGLADSKVFGVTYDATAAGYNANGNAILDIANGIKANAAVNALGQTINVSYIEDAAYIGLQAIRLKFAVADAEKWAQPITNLLGAFGIAVPDLEELTNGLKGLDAQSIMGAALTALDCVKSFTVNNGVITLSVKYGEYAAKLIVTVISDKDGGATVNIKLYVDDLVGIDATVTTATDEQIVEPEYAAYSDVTELIPAIESATQIVTTRGLRTVAAIAIGDMTLEATINATLDDGALQVLVTEDALGLSVKLLGDTAYIEVGGIKVSGRLADVTALIDSVIPNLPYTIRPYIEKMNEQIIGIIPSDEELGTADGGIEIAKLLGTVLDMLKRISVSDGDITVEICRGVLSATLGAKTDLSSVSGNVAMTFNGVGGPFGDRYVMAFDMGLGSLTAATVKVPQVKTEEYVAASSIIPMLNSILPLVKERALELNLNVTVFGQTINGNIFVDFGEYTLDTIAIKARLMVSDAAVTIAVIEKILYVDINGGSIRLAQPLTKAGIKNLISQLDEALPELGLADKINQKLDELKATFEDIDVAAILNMITLFHIDNGMALQIATGGIAVAAEVVMANNAITIGVNCNINGKSVSIGLEAVTDSDGVITSVATTKAYVMGTELGLEIAISPTEYGKASMDGDYLTADDIVPYITPIINLVNKAADAKTITVDLSGMTLEVMGKVMDVVGRVDISLNPVRVHAVLTLFAGTVDAIDLTVVYWDNVLYIELGDIRLKFDVGSDVDRLLAAVQDYLPPSLKNLKDFKEISKISALINDVTALTKANDATQALSILFDYNNAYGKSMAKQVMDMIRLGKSYNTLTASLTVMETPDITLNVSPILSTDGAYVDFNINTAIMSLLKLDCTASITFYAVVPSYTAPDATNEYVSVVDFVTTIVNAVNTLTAKMPETETTENGVTTNVKTIAFSVDSFAFDYDVFKAMQTVNENGEAVDVIDAETGRVVIEEQDGKKVVKQHIDVNSIAGKPALAFKYVTTTVTENGVTTKSSSVNIEAHIEIGIKELDADGKLTDKLGFPIELHLFVAPTEQYPDGLAYLHYKEATGYGEKISLDYNSIMEIVAAVLDILSVEDQSVESLLGKYRLDIDKTVFESMAIAGLDSITELLNNLIKAVDEAKLALGEVKNVLGIVYAEEDISNLISQFRYDELDGKLTAKAHLENAIDKVKNIIAYFATDDDADKKQEQEQPTDNKINGALFGKIVNAVSFAFKDNTLSAAVDNYVATGTAGTATVAVKHNGKKIDSITVDKLDVNTAKLNKFDMQFTAGEDLFAEGKAFSITVPTSEFETSGNTAYSDFGNIKHLLFDVMNTANMLEFDIGGLNTSDVINVKLNIAGLDMVNIDINYNVKVKIINTGIGENGKPVYKTAAVVELMFKDCTALSATVVPDCTTRLYFYDDVIYIQGVRAGQNSKIERVVGSVTDVECIATTFTGKKETRYPNRTGFEYAVDTTDNLDYVESMFTVDELFYMISNDMNTFLNEFLFYLVPLSRDFTIFHVDLQKEIVSAMSGSSGSTENPQNTIAQIFKEYAYSGGEHTMRIGLKELAGVSALSDLTVKITGKNDNDDGESRNVRNNYISKLHIDTSIQNNLVQINLDATLYNVRETSDGRIESKGIATTNVTREVGKYSANGSSYVYDCYHYDRNTLYTLDGKTYLTVDGNALYLENGTLSPALRRTDSSDTFVWTSTGYDKKYSENAYKAGDWFGTYYYTTSLAGYGYRYDGTDTYYIGTDVNGDKYVYRLENGNQVRVAVKDITTSLLAEVTRGADGKVATVTNRNGGIQWSRPWKAAYDAAQAA